MGIRPNGDVTPCPYLPVFGGNLKRSSLAQVWRDSEPFVRIRQREALGLSDGDAIAARFVERYRRASCQRV